MNEAKMILKMFDEGKITLEEAEALLEALGTSTIANVAESIRIEGHPVEGQTVSTSEKSRETDADEEDDEEEVEELVDQIEEEVDQLEDEIDNIEDELNDELDALQDEWDELEDAEGVNNTKGEELRMKMDEARARVESRREQLREEKKRIREQAREFKRQVRSRHGISEEIEEGMRELSRGLDEVRESFKKEGFSELRAAMRQLSEELNDGMSGLRNGLNEGAREIRRTFGGGTFRNLLNGIFSSISWSGDGIPLDEEITGSFDPAAGPVEIDLRTHNGRIEIQGTNEEGYRLHLHYTIPADSVEEAEQLKSEMVSITQESNLLRVRSLEHRRGSVAAQLFLPKSTEGNITLNSSNGRISVEELRNQGRLLLKTSNGRITLNGVRGKELQADTSNGRVELRDVAADMMDVETSNGSIFVEGICENITCRTSNGAISAYPYVMDQGNLKLTTSNGRIKVVLKNLDMGVDIESSTTMGSITLDVPNLEFERRYEKHQRHDYKAHTAGYEGMAKQLRIQANTSMGSVYIGRTDE